jgi:hypothetical protein
VMLTEHWTYAVPSNRSYPPRFTNWLVINVHYPEALAAPASKGNG